MLRRVVVLVVATLAVLTAWWLASQPAPATPNVVGAAATSDAMSAAVADPTAGGEPAAAPRTEVVAAPALGALRVRVVATVGDRQVPLPGVLVAAWPGTAKLPPLAESGLRRGTTDQHGERTWASLSAGTWQVQLPSQRDPTPQAVVVPEQGETTLLLNVPAERFASGLVVDSAGSPVAGAELWAQRPTGLGRYGMPEPDEFVMRRVGTSGADGRFEVPVLARETVLVACHPAYASSWGRFLANAVADLRLVLGDGPAALQVTVQAADGAPAQGAVVRLEPLTANSRRAADGTLLAPRSPRLAHTDELGIATFLGLAPGPMRVVASAWPSVPAHREIVLQPLARAELSLALGEGVAVVGHVRDSDGRPVRVQVGSRAAPDANGHWCQCDTREDGSFRLFHQPRRTFWIVAKARGGKVVATAQIVDPPAGTVVQDLVVEALPQPPAATAAPAPHTASLRGRLLAADGMPVAGRRLSAAIRTGGDERSLRTSADGTFAVENLAPGAWTLSHWRGGSPIELRTLELADTQALDLGNVVLPAEASLRLELVHADGTTWLAEPPGIELLRADGKAAVVEQSRSDGGIRVVADPGLYRVALRATDLLCDPMPVTLVAGESVALRLPLQIGRTCRLRFRHGETTPPAPKGLAVVVRDRHGAVVAQQEGVWRGTLTGASELLVTTTLPFGSYEVEGSDELGPRYRMAFALGADPEAPTEFDVPLLR